MKLLTLLMISFSTLAQQTYYVSTDGDNTNNGSQTNPWLTIQYGVDNISSGDTLLVKPGVYTQTVLIQSNFASVIKIRAQDNVVIDGNGITPIDRQGLITIRDASNIIVEGFEIRNFKTANGVEINNTPVGILMDGDISNVIIRNNTIHDIQNRSTCGQSTGCGPGANGIAVYGDTSTGIVDIELDNNEVYNCVLASSEAFTINGNVDRFKIINNYVHDNNNIAFDFIGYEDDVCDSCTDEMNRARNGYVKGNRAINNSIKLSVAGFATNPWYENDDGNAGGFYVDGGRNIIFDGNYSSQNDLGFEFASEHAGKSSEDILMINNYIYDNRELGLSIGGYAESTAGEGGGNAERINVYNNSFYKNQGWGTEINFAYRVIDFNAVNNIFYGTADLNDNFAQESNGQHSNTNFSNNIWWANDNSNSSGLPEASPIIINPQYLDANTGDLDISSLSPAINSGTSQVNIIWNSQIWVDLYGSNTIPVHGTVDINNQARIEGANIDIGADEYGTFVDLIFKHGFEEINNTELINKSLSYIPGNILFIGNSLTGWNGIPTMFNSMAIEAGFNAIIIDTEIYGGNNFKNHYERVVTVDKINNGTHDTVILQGGEFGAISASQYDDFINFGSLLNGLVEAANKTSVYYMTWHHRDSFPTESSLVVQNYQYLANYNNATLNPVGLAFAKMVTDHSGIDIFHDGTHQNLNGAYLSACMFYGFLLKKDPRNLNYLGESSNTVDPVTATILRDVAYQVLLDYNEIEF